MEHEDHMKKSLKALNSFSKGIQFQLYDIAVLREKF